MLQDTEEKKGDTQTHTQSSQERTHWCTRLMIGQVRWGQCALLCADKQTWALTLAHLNLDLMFISADWDQSNAWWWKQQQGTKMHFWWSLLSFFYFVCFFLTTKPAIPLVSATCEHTVQLYTSHACKDIGCVTGPRWWWSIDLQGLRAGVYLRAQKYTYADYEAKDLL